MVSKSCLLRQHTSLHQQIAKCFDARKFAHNHEACTILKQTMNGAPVEKSSRGKRPHLIKINYNAVIGMFCSPCLATFFSGNHDISLHDKDAVSNSTTRDLKKKRDGSF